MVKFYQLGILIRRTSQLIVSRVDHIDLMSSCLASRVMAKFRHPTPIKNHQLIQVLKISSTKLNSVATSLCTLLFTYLLQTTTGTTRQLAIPLTIEDILLASLLWSEHPTPWSTQTLTRPTRESAFSVDGRMVSSSMHQLVRQMLEASCLILTKIWRQTRRLQPIHFTMISHIQKKRIRVHFQSTCQLMIFLTLIKMFLISSKA